MAEDAARAGRPAQDEDRLPMRRVLLWGGPGLVAVLAGIAVAACWALGGERPLALPERVRGPRPPERIGGVLQTPIAPDPARARRAAPLGVRPDRFDWVDRERGVVRIPIEDAMEAVVREYGP